MTNLALDFEPADAPRPMGIQIAPLIDIVFLLICFFMLATQLIQTQSDTSVKLPAMSSHAGPDTPAELIINVRQDGRLRVDSEFFTTASLTGRLAAEQARRAGRNQQLRVVIRADRRQLFDQLDQVLDACRQAGISQIILRAERGE